MYVYWIPFLEFETLLPRFNPCLVELIWKTILLMFVSAYHNGLWHNTLIHVLSNILQYHLIVLMKWRKCTMNQQHTESNRWKHLPFCHLPAWFSLIYISGIEPLGSEVSRHRTHHYCFLFLSCSPHDLKLISLFLRVCLIFSLCFFELLEEKTLSDSSLTPPTQVADVPHHQIYICCYEHVRISYENLNLWNRKLPLYAWTQSKGSRIVYCACYEIR